MSTAEPSAKKKELIRSVKFTLFSISAGAIQFGTFSLLTLFTGMPYWPRYLITLALSVVYNFTINRKFTFQSAANIPLAMLKVFAYYCVFTPFSTVVGDYLVGVLYWNDFLVEFLCMFLNFVTEFLFTLFIVYGKNVDNSKSYLEKHEGAQKSDGPAVSRKAIVICIICTVISAAITVSVLVMGNKPDDSVIAEKPDDIIITENPDGDSLIGEWMTYSGGKTVTYSFDGSKAVLTDADGDESVYDYTIDGNVITLSNSAKTKRFEWTSSAVRFQCDHAYGEARGLLAEKQEKDSDFTGYMYVDGDFLYIGALCMCDASRMDGYTDTSLVGEWVGAAGDKLRFGSDGSYYYKDSGIDYNGTYTVDEGSDTLTLFLGGEGTLLDGPAWGVSGRVLHINDQYYFRTETQ